MDNEGRSEQAQDSARCPLSIVNYPLRLMPELNPYEAPQTTGKVPLAPLRRPKTVGEYSQVILFALITEAISSWMGYRFLRNFDHRDYADTSSYEFRMAIIISCSFICSIVANFTIAVKTRSLQLFGWQLSLLFFMSLLLLYASLPSIN